MEPVESEISLTMPVTAGRDHLLGDETARITLLEYGDFECPDCEMAHPIVIQVRATFAERLQFAFRHFPRTSIHPHAAEAAQAAEAAGAQRKFWPMHDILFQHQK